MRDHPLIPARQSVHPHSRGEHRFLAVLGFCSRGSSPLAWGAFCLRVGHFLAVRFIPTRVGSITCRPTGRHLNPVHPHSRGEHGRGEVPGGEPGGSSPLAWGACLDSKLFNRHARFIPTRVGSIWLKTSTGNPLSVHPHSRGEHGSDFAYLNVLDGSSPLAWGAFRPTR